MNANADDAMLKRGEFTAMLEQTKQEIFDKIPKKESPWFKIALAISPVFFTAVLGIIITFLEIKRKEDIDAYMSQLDASLRLYQDLYNRKIELIQSFMRQYTNLSNLYGMHKLTSRRLTMWMTRAKH